MKIGLWVFFGRKYIHSPLPNDNSGVVTASATILVTPWLRQNRRYLMAWHRHCWKSGRSERCVGKREWLKWWCRQSVVRLFFLSFSLFDFWVSCQKKKKGEETHWTPYMRALFEHDIWKGKVGVGMISGAFQSTNALTTSIKRRFSCREHWHWGGIGRFANMPCFHHGGEEFWYSRHIILPSKQC